MARFFEAMPHLRDFSIGVVSESDSFRLPFHRVLLASESTFFNMIFKNQSNLSEYLLPPEVAGSSGHLQMLHDWLYGRRDTVALHNDRQMACELYLLGDYLGVSSLMQHCQEAILDDLNVSNVIELLVFSDHVISLQAALLPEVARRATELLHPTRHRHHNLGRVSLPVLEALVSSRYIFTGQEKLVWDLIKRWVRSQCSLSQKDRTSAADRLVRHVRPGLLPFRDFMQLWSDYVQLTAGGHSAFLSRWFDYQVWKHARPESPLTRPALTEEETTQLTPRTPNR